MSQQQLIGKVALVTGASSGMGRATAIALAQQGAKIICWDLNEMPNPNGYEEDLHKSTVQVIKGKGGDALFQEVDISNLPLVERAFEYSINQFGRLDILVNCAGFWAPFRRFVDEDDELWSKMLAVNSAGTSKTCRLAVRQFLKQDICPNLGSRGRIVNISSCAAQIAYAGEAAYSASKAAVEHMTRAAAIDHAKDSININGVSPGVVATGMARVNLEDSAVVDVMKKATPWPRLGTSSDIAEAVMYFCLPMSQWVTGQILPVDGGMTLGVPSN